MLADEWLAAAFVSFPSCWSWRGRARWRHRGPEVRGRSPDNPHLDIARFLEACAFFRIGSNDTPPTLRTLSLLI
jgi:hypothetical protein